MSVENGEQQKQGGWLDETISKKNSLHTFLSQYYTGDQTRDYDSIVELHVSGGVDVDNLDIQEIMVLYENNEIIKIRVTFPGNNEVFMQGRALEDYLRSII